MTNCNDEKTTQTREGLLFHLSDSSNIKIHIDIDIIVNIIIILCEDCCYKLGWTLIISRREVPAYTRRPCLLVPM